MFTVNPCENTTVGASSGPTTFTASSVPSKERTRRSRPGRSASGSPRSGSGRDRACRTMARSAATAAVAPATTPPATRSVLRVQRFMRPWASPCGSASSRPVLPGHARPHPAHHLVADRAGPRGHLAGADRLAPLPADQDDLVTRGHGVIAAVHHDLVHGDGAGNSIPPSVDEHLSPIAQQPVIPVRVPDGHRGDGGFTAEPV